MPTDPVPEQLRLGQWRHLIPPFVRVGSKCSDPAWCLSTSEDGKLTASLRQPILALELPKRKLLSTHDPTPPPVSYAVQSERRVEVRPLHGGEGEQLVWGYRADSHPRPLLMGPQPMRVPKRTDG